MGSLRFVRLLAVATVLSIGAFNLALAASGGECPDDYQIIVKAEDVTLYATDDSFPAGTKVNVDVKVMNTTTGVDTMPLNSWGFRICGNDTLLPRPFAKGYCVSGGTEWDTLLLAKSQWQLLATVEFTLQYSINHFPTTIEIPLDSFPSNEPDYKFRYRCNESWHPIDVQQFESGSVTFTQPTDSTVTFAMDTVYCDPEVDSVVTIPVSFAFDTSGTLQEFEVEISWDSLALDLLGFSEDMAFPEDWAFVTVDIRDGYAHFYAADTSGGCNDVIQGNVFDLHFRPLGLKNGEADILFGEDNQFDYCHGLTYKPGNLVNGVVVFVDKIPPSAVIDLSVGYEGSDYVSLTWTAPGNDGNQGTAYRYDIRYSTNPVGADTTAWWEGADTVAGEPAPAPAGTGQQFKVEGLVPHSAYYFALRTADEVPNWSGISNIASGTPVGVKGRKTSKLPRLLALLPNYPNPFNSTTLIRYQLPAVGDAILSRGQRSAVSLRIYNIRGQLARVLVDREQGAGRYGVTWDGCDSRGEPLSSGVYLCRIKAGSFSKIQKMVLLK